ncbi:MAG: glutamine-hydrolyzing GMP synthase [Firmicutes bacterium]|nr:glutamine-hydrolyzing GMP synthase [Bacillota bacterium]
MDHDLVIILDFGSQYSMLIARKTRELGVYSEIVGHGISAEEIERRHPKGIILSGGPASVYQEGALRCDGRIFQLGIPLLGICYGMQLMAVETGGKVAPASRREYGKTRLYIDDASDLFAGFAPENGESPSTICWMSHGDSVMTLPPGFEILAHTDNTPAAAMRNKSRCLWGIQFHPEVVHTERGMEILRNFLFKICDINPTWTPAAFVDESVKRIREQIGNGRAVVALSGGVDSSVAALLVHKAIKDRLTGIFVNNGLLRKGEPELVLSRLRDHFKLNVIYVDAEARFLSALKGVRDPEEKRRRIGHEFIRIFEEESGRLGDVEFLVQGTLYPDVIESTATDTGPAARIKSHHNVGGLPERMNLKLVEPLRYMFKDEVRRAALEIGLPEEMVWRHPFPGPGLAVRIIGPVTRSRLNILREADAIVEEEIRKAGLYRDLWQSFAVLPAIRSVGVMGDQRTYAYPIVIRAITSEDGMTADWARLPYDLIERISSRIISEVPHVNRVVYDVSSKPPATIEWE